ncbi:MAG: phage replisome organizer N-terminal domain-containing protein, partial [Lachnospiraceae bacterium]|nr:phage replisome organizer N-terminal domain-containing protein [Lachnospiraceae bacterium]
MAKKYYWMKLREDFFEDDTMEWLEEQPNGKEYALFYLKLCLKSVKTNGLLVRNVGNIFVPYDTRKLAEITHTDFDTAVVAMEIFKNIGLVEILEGGQINIPRMEEMIGSETDKAAMMRKIREQKKFLAGNNVTKMLPEKGNSNITKNLPEGSGNNVTPMLPEENDN